MNAHVRGMPPTLALAVVLLLGGLAPPFAACPEAFSLETDVVVPMRDAVVLRADVMRPKQEGQFPVLLYRTPYGKHAARESYTTFARAVERGYAVVIQDVRGRYASEGEFVAYQHEAKDGYDTIEWAARQPWSNGAVGTFGLSYPGAVQWLAAVENPPHLRAMVPAMTFSSPELFFYSGGVFDMSWIAWIWFNIAPDVRVRKNLEGPKTREEAAAAWPEVAEQMRRHLPLTSLPNLKEVAPFYYEWMQHPPGDRWWRWAALEGKYQRVQAAVLNLSGWHDEAYGPSGALQNYLGLRRARRGQPDPRAALVLGPWTHGVGSLSQTRAGDREFGAAAAIDYDELVLGWMDHHLKGLETEKATPPVRVFVMGANEWRLASDWPAAPTQRRSLYLQPSGSASWEAPREDGSASAFTADPQQPVVDPFADSPGAHDQRALANRSDVLTFTSPPLANDLEVVGEIEVELYVSSEARDADFWVRLLDVHADGTAYNLMSPGLDVLRASYRDGGPRRKLLTPGRIYRLRLPNLMTGNVFQKSHRIQVQVMGSYFPHFSRNLQTGASEHVSAETRAATHRIYHERTHASRLLLPVLAPR